MHYTTKQAAEYLGLSHVRVWQLIQKKRLHAEKFGRDWIITEAELVRFKQLDRPPHRPKAQ